MRRISSPVAGMKAPCVFSGARAEWETAAGYQDNNSLLIVQQASGFSKGGRGLAGGDQMPRTKHLGRRGSRKVALNTVERSSRAGTPGPPPASLSEIGEAPKSRVTLPGP